MKKSLSTMSLALITVGSVDSIRNLPTAALIGSDMLYYFCLALIFFLLPCAVVSAWFAKQVNQGVYGWVKQSLGPRWGLFAVRLQWMQNILIYPTFFSFIAGSLLYGINPNLVENKLVLFFVINVLLWGLTWVNLQGIHVSSRLNTVCTLIGLILPFIFILLIGLDFILTHPLSLNYLPQANTNPWACLTAIILSFCGVEIAAVHLNTKQTRSFTWVMLISVIIIFTTMLLGALTLAMVLPVKDLNFINDIPRLFHHFFMQTNYPVIAHLINGLIVIGCLGCANNWLIAPLKGLTCALKEDECDVTLFNNEAVLNRGLLLQGLFISLMSACFLLFPAINTAYWFLLCLATQLYLLMYLLVFIACLVLLQRMRHSFNYGVCIAVVMGLVGTVAAIGVSFQPPSLLAIGNHWAYELKLFLSLIAVLLLNYFIQLKRIASVQDTTILGT